MLCESRRAVGEALGSTLSRSDGIECLGVAKTYWAARRQLQTTDADVIIVGLDYHDAEMRALIGEAGNARVAILASPVTAQMLTLEQQHPNFTIVSSVAPLADLVRNLKGEEHQDLNGVEVPTGQLSDREFETLTLLVEGMTATQMAAHLNLSIHTIRFHIKALFNKLNVSTQAGAILAGIEQGFVSAPTRTTHLASAGK